jgi:DNA-binding FrmR family transcriptional regulator
MVRRTSYGAHKEALIQRLRRMEGQVRGLQQMIEDQRYCLEVIQQITAVTAAAREVAMIIVEDHLRQCITDAADEAGREAAIREMVAVLSRIAR